jgi:hypothetical protein
MLRHLLVVATGVSLCTARVAPVEAATLLARMFPLTGEIRLKNDSVLPVPIVFYSIESNAGGLNGSPVRWVSITDHYDAPVAPFPGNGFIDPNGAWVKLSSATTELAEGALDLDGGRLPAKREISLGQIWNPSIAGLTFAATEPNGQPISILPVEAIDGDYDWDGQVDAADYVVWRQNFSSTSMLDADGNVNGIVDAADYSVWRNNFGRSLLGSATAAAMGASMPPLLAGPAVPEPASVVVVGTAIGILIACGRRLPRRPTRQRVNR